MKPSYLKSVFAFILIFVFGLFPILTFAQNANYSTTVNASSGQSYSVDIMIELTGIVPTQTSCNNGYNYNIAYNYDIQFNGSAPTNLWTLQGSIDCGANQGIFFNLPTSPGSGTGTTTGNPWRNVSDCATATVQSLECNSIDIQIQGPGITNQTITVEPSSDGGETKWDRHGDITDSTDFMGTKNYADLRFRTNNIEHFRITRDGKFGIGIQNPTFDFEVNKTASFNDNIYFRGVDSVSNTSGRSILVVDNNGKIEKINGLDLDPYNPGPIDIGNYCQLNTNYVQNPTWLNGLNKIFTPCPEIKVGIGTNSPQAELDVNGTILTTNLKASNTVEVGRAYSAFSMISGFMISPNNRELITIGQYNPQTQEEKVTLQLKSSGELVLNYTSNYGNTSTDDVFRVNSTDDNKNLLLLENSGLLRARRIIINQQTWADYVFEKDYELLPLDELQYFIQIHGHLPEVPTTEEVEENGVDLAQTNVLLLKKIEELTLYLLEQKEETDALRKELEELKALVQH